jgi:ferredoxin
MARADTLVKLAWAYGVHLARRRLRRHPSELVYLLETYAPDGIRPVDAATRQRHPRLLGCINCGLCALAAGRVGRTRLPDLASSYMRLYARLGEASSDVDGEAPDLLDTYAPDGIRPVDAATRLRHPRLLGCINCGLCALAAGRVGRTRLPDLASSYMRLYARLGEASSDVDGEAPDLLAASAACPVGLPLDEVADAVRRMTGR